MIAHFIQVTMPVLLIIFCSIISTLFMGVKLTQSKFGDMFMANSYKRVLWLPALLFFTYARNLSSNIKVS